MKRVLGVVSILGVFGLCAVLLSGCAPKRNLTGTWTGTITISDPRLRQPLSVPLTLHVTKKDDGTYAAAVDNPMAGHGAVPMESLKLDGDKVTFSITKGADFTGKTNSDATEITGNVSYSGKDIPVTLKKQPEAKIAHSLRSSILSSCMRLTYVIHRRRNICSYSVLPQSHCALLRLQYIRRENAERCCWPHG